MRRFKRILTAPLRLRTSRGFGVHSPFAFTFITDVLKQRYGYYAYERQEARHSAAAGARRRGVNPLEYQRLVFRVVNYFSPQVIGSVGYGSGLETLAALDVSSKSVLVQAVSESKPSFSEQVVSEVSDRIETVDSPLAIIPRFGEGSTPLLLVNSASADRDTVAAVMAVLNSDGVVVFTRISQASQLWQSVNSRLKTHGMTFACNVAGVIVGLSHLPRQSYRIWV